MNLTWLYVAALYASRSGLRAARSATCRGAWPRCSSCSCFVFLWRPLTQDVVIVPADVIKLTPPWSEMRAPNRPPVTKYDVSNTEPARRADADRAVDAPGARVVARARGAALERAAGCGYPLLANGQSTPFSPLRLLTLPLPLGHAMTAECAMKLLLALVLTYPLLPHALLAAGQRPGRDRVRVLDVDD